MGEMREMTLSEFLATLPKGHLARREFADLEAENERLRGEIQAIAEAFDEHGMHGTADHVRRAALDTP